ETDQIIYLDSLSKGWVHEQVFGVAIVPENDFGTFRDSFRRLALSQEKLFQAWEILFNQHQFPITFMAKLDENRASIATFLSRLGLNVLPAAQGYLVAIDRSASNLLEEHHLLTIPATVFGSKLPHWSIASSLPNPTIHDFLN